MTNNRNILYPGSFDPITNGHLDLIERASKLFDKVFVAVAVNDEKKSMFSTGERVDLIKNSCLHLSNIEVIVINGLLVEEIRVLDVHAILRGLRAFSDFEYELQMALMNRKLNEDCETIFMMPSQDNSFISSRLIKEIATLNGDFSKFVPQPVTNMLKSKLNS